MKMEGKLRSRVGRYSEGFCRGIWDFLEPFTRLWGVATSVVMCGVGVELTLHRHVVGVYILIASGLVFFLEIMWAITLFIDLCTNHNEYTVMLRCWDAISCCHGWKRAPVYAIGGVVLLAWPRVLWLTRVAGSQLVILAVLHALLTARNNSRHPLLPDQHHHLVSDHPSERYEDITEVLDDTLPVTDNVMQNSHSSTATPSVREQDAILEI